MQEEEITEEALGPSTASIDKAPIGPETQSPPQHLQALRELTDSKVVNFQGPLLPVAGSVAANGANFTPLHRRTFQSSITPQD